MELLLDNDVCTLLCDDDWEMGLNCISKFPILGQQLLNLIQSKFLLCVCFFSTDR